MRSSHAGDILFIADDNVFRVRQHDGPERTCTVVLTMNDKDEWTFFEPPWRPMAFGTTRGRAYIWSARTVIFLPQHNGEAPQTIGCDEDILGVIGGDESSWILICETSARLFIDGDERSRLDFRDVVEKFRSEGEAVLVITVEGQDYSITTRNRKLFAEARERGTDVAN